MKYCTRCFLPDTKPYLRFDEQGVCSACHAFDKENNTENGIDWDDRKRQLDNLVADIKAKKAPYYDVLVPVSGGKDSLTQVVRMREYGLRVLAVSVECGIKTENGRYNLDLVPNMGATLITYKPEQSLHKKLIRIGFENYGDPDFMSHALLMAAPLHIAQSMQIPLLFLGESMDYAGECDTDNGKYVTRKWYQRYGMNQERGADFIAQNHNISRSSLTMYDFPKDFEEAGTQAVFMSYFFRWDAEEHVRIAEQHGFKRLPQNLEGTIRNYVNTDDKINRIHHYMKVLKFGYGRATDHVSEDMRKGKLDRETGRELIRQHDLTTLGEYYYDDFCQYLGYSHETFFQLLEKNRNLSIWKKNENDEYFIPGWLKDES